MMSKEKAGFVQVLGMTALCLGLLAVPASAQDFPSTADIMGMPAEPLAAGEHSYTTSPEQLGIVLTPLTQLKPLTGSGSTTMISQIGNTNFANAGVEGTGNAAMIAQSGTNNRAVQAIQGSNSAMLLVQSGNDNNVLQASKGSNNAQMLGVSGSNNDVAYLQVGNDLAGAMNVGGSNSAVFALQTPGSGNYMMPSGLTGLKDQVVIVVPGRMYVFNRN
jgi:hypothetical protein